MHKILIVNSLDARYGSTYRLRAIRRQLERAGFSISYVERDGSAAQKCWAAATSALGKYDLLFTQKFNPITLLAIILARARGKPAVVDWDDWDVGLQGTWLKRAVAVVSEWIGPRFACGITTHSQQILKHASSFATTELIGQGFDETLFDPALRNHADARARWGFKPDDLIVGHLCTMTSGGAMDLPAILRSWADPILSDAKFLVVGGGPLEANIRAEIESLGLVDRVKMTGLIPQEEVPSALRAMDASVIYMRDTASNRARVSFKVIESLAMNVPVVGQIVGETNRLFGQWVAQTDFARLPEATARLLKTRDHPKTSQNVKPYAWSQTTRRLPGILRSLLEEERE